MKTQKERILEVLKDGAWHSSLDFVYLNPPILRGGARIFELRADGHNITTEVLDGVYKFKLEKPQPKPVPSAMVGRSGVLFT